MSVTLGDDDRRAVDLLLDRDSSRTNGGETALAADGNMQKRVQRVGHILSTLSHMTADDPAPDLVKRALQRIEEARTNARPVQPMDRSIDITRPLV